MKKSPFLLVALLVFSLALAFVTDWGLPSELDGAPAASGEGGIVYAADNDMLFSTVYGFDSEGETVFFYREFNHFGESSITQLACEGDFVYFLRETPQDAGSLWEPVRLARDGTAEPLGSALVSGRRSSSLTAPSYVAALDGGGEASAAVLDAADGSVLLAAQDFTQYLPIYASYSAGEEALYVQDGRGNWFSITSSRQAAASLQRETAALPESVTVPLNIRLACKAPFLGAAALCSLAAWLLLLFLFLVVRRSKKLAVRASTAAGFFLLVSLAVIGAVMFRQSYGFRVEGRLEEARQSAVQTAESVSALAGAELLSSGFSDSEGYQTCARLLALSGAELFLEQDGSLAAAVSGQNAIGVSAGEALGAAAAAQAEQAMAGKEAEAWGPAGKRQAVTAAAPVLLNGVAVGVVVESRSAGDIFAEAARQLASTLLTGLCLLVVSCGLLTLLLWRMTSPLGRLSRQMEEISEGKLKMERIAPSRDELGQMAKSMQEMCMGLSIRDYELQSTLKSYGRFIPRDLASLLDRASVMEVSFGDVKSITGNVAVLAAVNRDRARAELDDAPFVDYVNRCFAAVNHSVSAHGGYILSSGFDMGMLRLYFPGSAQPALTSALELLGETKGEDTPEHPLPKFLLILHQTTFLYGVAGSDEQAFPFLSSQEMEFLSSYSRKLADAGSQIVLTHKFMSQLPKDCHIRYIGYVTDEATQESYKLYELLDAYPELERNLRLWYDKDFQEAIQLFYRSDFYLARTIFSNLLRSCPGDGIAKWYLFACESYFQSGAGSDFQLFSIDP